MTETAASPLNELMEQLPSTLLKEELFERQLRNPNYSLRSYARALGVSAGFLSPLLTGKKRVSPERATEILARLKWPERKEKIFRKAVQWSRAGDAERPLIEESLVELLRSGEKEELDVERFRVISRWYHGAILSLSEIEDFQPDPHWIAQRLAITEMEADLALERLLRLGLLEREATGRCKRGSGLFSTGGMSSDVIRQYHRELFQKAIRAIDERDFSERELYNLTIATNPDHLTEVREKLPKLCRELRDDLKVGKKTRVYQLSVALFPLDRKTESESSLASIHTNPRN